MFPVSRTVSLRTSGFCQPARLILGTFPAPSALRNQRRRDHALTSIEYGKRRFSLDVLSTVLIPPLVFTGLGLSLWAYKCLMMVVFQNKIIYMPGVPPFSRSEKVADYAQRCNPVRWEEEHIRASDGTRISLLTGEIDDGSRGRRSSTEKRDHLLVFYFQGNASSLPPRTPYLSDTLKAVNRLASADQSRAGKKISLIAVSYRGFWTSRGRPSQRGIELDAAAALAWAINKYSPTANLSIVLWGQSIGAGVATTATAMYQEARTEKPGGTQNPIVRGLILETPFTHLGDLLLEFYPQRWLPYRYLSPFLRSHWDSKLALDRIARMQENEKPAVLILQAGKDEVVPAPHGEQLEKLCESLKLGVERSTIHGALHTEVTSKPAGRETIARYLLRFL